MEQVTERPDMDEAVEPVLLIQLVLRVPVLRTETPHHAVRRRSLRTSQADLGNPLASARKVVKFSQDKDSSGMLWIMVQSKLVKEIYAQLSSKFCWFCCPCRLWLWYGGGAEWWGGQWWRSQWGRHPRLCQICVPCWWVSLHKQCSTLFRLLQYIIVCLYNAAMFLLVQTLL